MDITDRGLNLSRLDDWTPAEEEAFRSFYTENLGAPLPAYELWVELRPDVLKRHRLQALQVGPHMPWFALLFLHYYTVVGYEDGIAYEIRNAQVGGITKAQVVETLAVAFLHSGPLGMRYVASSSRQALQAYEESPPREPVFPPGWEPDPAAFRSGVDFSTPELSEQDCARIERWYAETLGEVPPHVRFLAEHRPGLLKVSRNRFETSIQDALPKQMMPMLLLHLNVCRGFAEGIREALLLARAFGVTRELALVAISWGMLYGGTAAMSIVERSAGDVLRTLAD